LSAQLLAALTNTTATPPAPAPAPSTPAKPVEASALVGNWKTGGDDSGGITLALTKDGKYTWKVNQTGSPRQFNGDYTVADGLLILKQGASPMMVGQVTMLSGGQFNFKLPGENPGDPGLTFAK
jgi:hypothetical protein